jgi:hypothetical protein
MMERSAHERSQVPKLLIRHDWIAMSEKEKTTAGPSTPFAMLRSLRMTNLWLCNRFVPNQ